MLHMVTKFLPVRTTVKFPDTPMAPRTQKYSMLFYENVQDKFVRPAGRTNKKGGVLPPFLFPCLCGYYFFNILLP